MPQSHVRASDVDREAVARVLGEHMSAGRLTLEEFDDRVARAFAAKTYGELAELTADLPAARASGSRTWAPHETSARPVPAPTEEPRPRPIGGCGPCGWGANGHRDLAQGWRAWLSTSAIVVTIYLITGIASGGLGYFWPIWVIGPWGAVLLAQTLTGRGGDHRRRQLGA